MSITIIHRYHVREFFAVLFLTPHGFGYHHFCRDSVLHVHQRLVPLLGLKKKRPQRPYSKPSKTRKPQSNPDPVQAPTPEGDSFDGSVTMCAAPSPRPYFKPSDTRKPQSYNPDPVPAPTSEGEFFGGSVTICAAPSPRHVPIPIFCGREMTNVSSKLTKT